jgi:hypothetical protein
MSQAVELILTRQLASYLTMPLFLVDPSGDLLFYNEAAEVILGRRFSETGRMPAAEWSTIFTPATETGEPLNSEKLPLVITLTEHCPAHGRFWIAGLDGVRRHIEVTSFPLIGLGERFVGAVALFWELHNR